MTEIFGTKALMCNLSKYIGLFCDSFRVEIDPVLC